MLLILPSHYRHFKKSHFPTPCNQDIGYAPLRTLILKLVTRAKCQHTGISFGLGEAETQFLWDVQPQGPRQVPYQTCSDGWFGAMILETQPAADSSSPFKDHLRCLTSNNKYFSDDDFQVEFIPQMPDFGPAAHMTLSHGHPMKPTS